MKKVTLSRERLEQEMFDFEFAEIASAAFPFTAYSDGTVYDANGKLVWEGGEDSWTGAIAESEGIELDVD